eukprot:TRINITY_DN2133_c3_g1_i1.p1 TRINITY_DN2133_c3_g1~~TRINITY_DN2133_c3_g1_i1.p1  ORF type:complete len:318 (+),score=68.04 TRINITY_DN2133_c3_g1_i1:103-1056(+)
MGKPRKQVPLKLHLLGGACGGAFSTICLHPLDLIKTRFQVADGLNPLVREQYKSVFSAAKTIIQKETWKGLFKGALPGTLGASTAWGVYFFLYEHAKNRHKEYTNSETLSAPRHVLASWEAGTLSCLLLNPIWLIKTRLQLQTNAHTAPYRGMVDVVTRVIKEEGLFALYKGIIPALWLVSHGVIQFVCYEELKKAFLNAKPDKELNSLHYFLFGGTAKVIASTSTYPFQVVKSRLQQRYFSSDKRVYRGFFQSLRCIFQNEGVRGLYRGLTPNLYRVAPSAALTFVAYEFVVRKFKHLFDVPTLSNKTDSTSTKKM